MELGSLISLGTSSIDLASKLTEIIREYKKSGDNTRIREILIDLKKAAIKITSNLNEELTSMNSELFSSGVDIHKSLNELYADLRWYDWPSRSKIKNCERKLKSVYEQLAGFIDDVTAIAVCSDNKEPLSLALSRANKRTQYLHSRFNAHLPIGQIFNSLIDIIREIKTELQA